MDRTAARPLVIVAAFAASLLVGLLVTLWAMGGVKGVTAPAAIGGPFHLSDQSFATLSEIFLNCNRMMFFLGFYL
jgi:protein SCO1/2